MPEKPIEAFRRAQARVQAMISAQKAAGVEMRAKVEADRMDPQTMVQMEEK
jgi:hypothetical protein